jgi:hypothetical protein
MPVVEVQCDVNDLADGILEQALRAVAPLRNLPPQTAARRPR